MLKISDTAARAPRQLNTSRYIVILPVTASISFSIEVPSQRCASDLILVRASLKPIEVSEAPATLETESEDMSLPTTADTSRCWNWFWNCLAVGDFASVRICTPLTAPLSSSSVTKDGLCATGCGVTAGLRVAPVPVDRRQMRAGADRHRPGRRIRRRNSCRLTGPDGRCRRRSLRLNHQYPTGAGTDHSEATGSGQPAADPERHHRPLPYPPHRAMRGWFATRPISDGHHVRSGQVAVAQRLRKSGRHIAGPCTTRLLRGAASCSTGERVSAAGPWYPADTAGCGFGRWQCSNAVPGRTARRRSCGAYGAPSGRVRRR